ncbi:tape measure protein [Phocaeicola dorei]|uniref:tape measure protein n=2 Tax=Phocaeicola dorei TaxID=357276 RepID=UPI0032EB520E
MANNEAGAFLNITPDVLKKLDSFDEKLEKIEKHAHTAADALKNGFGSVVVDTSKLESAIASLASKISSIGSKGNPFEGVSKGAGDTEKKTTSMNESLSRAADLLNRIGDKKIGQGSFSGWNIAGLKESISDLKKFVENTQTISKQQQQTAVNAMRYMKMELDYQRQTDEQRVQSAEKTAQRKEAADRRAAKAAEQLARQQEIAQRTTPQGALDYSRNAKYLRDQVTAINYLKQARLSLNTTDANYRQTLEQINQAIAKHNQALQQAGVQSQQLATRHRNLMDTAGQLSRQLALVFSVSQIEGYISKLANVRGEFELQQRSLEAILQNKAQADQIFNKTVQLAVKSPFQIKELVTFTKQLAAYRIESDKLYDTTKRLADVSAGLGVDMGRLILAYGQVKAAAYLRGTEVRQFTEAGINLYGELQRYFEEVKGEAYTTAQIVDMISKRKVTFEDIENIFKRLTDSGGLFYNMQEIQAETLQGKISNLKDSIDVMLNSIGKANEDTLKGSIDSIKVLIDNWETVVEVAKAFGIVVGSMVLLPKIKAAANGVSLLSFAFTKAETALRSLGLAFKTSFPLIALGAALQLVNELWNVHSQYNKMLRESSNKYYTAQLRIGEIDEIAKNDTRKALSSLVKEMNNEGFEIEIKPNISEKEAKEQFEEYKKQYTEFLEDIRKIEANYAENRKKGWLIGNDDIETDLDEYENAFYDFIAKGNKIQAELLRISEESTSLGKGAKEYIQELVKGKKEGENLIDYYKRLADYLEKLQNGVLFAGKKSSIASSFLGTKKDLEKDKEEATKEIREIFDSVNDEVIKGNKTREQFKILIDKGDFSKQWSDIKKQLAYDIYNLGDIKVPLRPGINQEDPQSNPKHERDILAERISLIKELNKEYEKLNKVMGSDKAAKTVMERYASQLKDVQMPKNIIGEAFLPNKENTAKALQELAKIITDFRKKIGAQKDANVLFDEKDADDFKKQLDKTKDNIESMFNGLDLYNKMKKEGFSDEMIKSLFGDLTTTESEIQAEIEKLAGKEGELWEKAYDDLNKKLKSKQDEMFKNRIEQYAQFINDFNNQIENKQEEFADYMKIARDMLNKTGDVKAFTDQVGNIIAKYNQDIAKIETEKFKKSGTYIEMMGELSIKSADELQALIESLEDFIAKSASNIPADTLKIYINRLNEANEQLDKVKNPFGKSFIKGIKEITELQNKYNAEKSYQNELLQKQVELENELRDIESKRDIAKANGDDTTNFENQIVDIQDLIKDNDNSIANSSAKLQGMSTQMGKMTQGAGAVIGIIDKIVKGIDDSIQATADLFNEIKDIASSYGVDTESGGWQDLSIAMSSLSEMSTNVSNSWNSFKSGDFAGAAVSAIKSVGSVIKGINAIHDAKYERKIKRQQKNIESLQDAYEILKEKIDKAWDITSLNNATKQTTQNIDQQIRSYQEMINAEQKKKDTDDERIKEWNEAIKELQKTKEEIIKQEQMDLGGIGGESEYRDAAESFVQAWMDAFNETEDGLKALNENFNDFIENLIVKQATMRLAQARLKNLFDMIDKSVTEDSDGGISITQKELADIYAEATTSMKGLNEDLLSFVETLGYKPSKKANLSALQQGIQGITETTAEALEALLNSIRFFVSQQTTDITAIRNLLDARYSLESQAETNPMLIELKAQTGYLEIISDRIDRVFAPNSNSRGAGLRVFISD